MNLNSSLLNVGDGSLPVSCENLKSKLPLKWIQSCLQDKGTATLRRRKLPVEQMAWLVCGGLSEGVAPLLAVDFVYSPTAFSLALPVNNSSPWDSPLLKKNEPGIDKIADLS